MIANTIKTQASTGSSVDEYATGKNGRGPFKKGMDLRTPNLLVVDDDATVRQQLERLYTQSGYSVVTVSSAEEGIARLAEEDIDFAITDIKLPGMDGVQLISYIHQNLPDVPVIAITGYSDIQTAVNALKLGASDFVVKPFDLAAVTNQLALRSKNQMSTWKSAIFAAGSRIARSSAVCSAKLRRCIGYLKSFAWSLQHT